MIHKLVSQVLTGRVIRLAVIMTAGSLAAGQGPTMPTAAQADVIETEIERIHREIDNAIVGRERGALERMLTDDFTCIHAGGGIDSRAVFLELVSAGTALQRQETEDYAEFDVVWHIYDGRTAIRRSRVRFRYAQDKRELWLLQSKLFVKADRWRMATSQGTRIYQGPIVDSTTYQHLAGEYHSDSGASLVLSWHGGGILARWPDNGRSSQIFPVSAAEFDDGFRRLRFTFDADGRAARVARVQGAKEVWQGSRLKGK